MKGFSSRRSGGFTLIELLAVLGIIALIGTLGVVLITNTRKSAQIKHAEALVNETRTAVEYYYNAMMRYPEDDEGLAALYTRPDDEEEAKKWSGGGGPWLKDGKVPKDAWGNELKYVKVEAADDAVGRKFHVYSFGPNKIDDNGSDDDIPAWAENTP